MLVLDVGHPLTSEGTVLNFWLRITGEQRGGGKGASIFPEERILAPVMKGRLSEFVHALGRPVELKPHRLDPPVQLSEQLVTRFGYLGVVDGLHPGLDRPADLLGNLVLGVVFPDYRNEPGRKALVKVSTAGCIQLLHELLNVLFCVDPASDRLGGTLGHAIEDCVQAFTQDTHGLSGEGNAIARLKDRLLNEGFR